MATGNTQRRFVVVGKLVFEICTRGKSKRHVCRHSYREHANHRILHTLSPYHRRSNMMMMMMMRRFVERVLNSPQTRCPSQSNRWDLRCRANARGESVAIRRAAGRLFQMCGPATAKLLIPSVVVVLGTNSARPGVSRPEMSLAGDSRNCLTVIDQVNWRQSMQAFEYYHGELVYLILWRTGSQ